MIRMETERSRIRSLVCIGSVYLGAGTIRYFSRNLTEELRRREYYQVFSMHQWGIFRWFIASKSYSLSIHVPPAILFNLSSAALALRSLSILMRISGVMPLASSSLLSSAVLGTAPSVLPPFLVS